MKILYKSGKAGLPGAEPGPSVPTEVADCHAMAFIRPRGWLAVCRHLIAAFRQVAILIGKPFLSVKPCLKQVRLIS